MKVKFVVALGLMVASLGLYSPVMAESFVIDKEGAHASINFKIQHLGFSWLTGRFDRFTGTFDYDKDAPEKSSLNVEIDTASVNSNHAKRDKHLRSADFLDVAKFPKATFVSTGVKSTGEGTVDITGKLTMHGVSKEIVIKAKYVGGGDDPWGGFRRGFEGTTRLKLKDFGINFNLGPAGEYVELSLYVEGIRK